MDRTGFTLRAYKAALRSYLDAGYAVTSFSDYLKCATNRHLVLRHDVDNSIEQALRIAHADARTGCTSSFYVRVHARGYNLLSLQSLTGIREIEDLGHEVQLHLEGGIGAVLGDSDISWADRQRTIFEAAVGRPLGGFSVHEPARVGGVDSNGAWREGHFRDWVGRDPLMHVLTHPIWWFEHSPAENY